MRFLEAKGDSMKGKLWLVLLPAVCLCWQTNQSYARQGPAPGTDGSAEGAPAQSRSVPGASGSPNATGRIAGVLKDPSGAVVPGGKIEVTNLASGIKRSLATDRQGRFTFDEVPAGRYQVTVHATGFEIAVIHDLSVTAGSEASANIALKIAPARTDIEVKAPAIGAGAAIPHTIDESDRARSLNTAELMGNTPGVSLRENGQLASIPFLHGLGDERAKLVVDGMTVSSACPNHMNPPLSYIAPSHAAKVTVM